MCILVSGSEGNRASGRPAPALPQRGVAGGLSLLRNVEGSLVQQDGGWRAGVDVLVPAIAGSDQPAVGYGSAFTPACAGA